MSGIPEHILKKLDQWGMTFVKTKGREPTLDEVNEYLSTLILQENERPSETLDGYSPSQLFTTKNFPLDEDSIIQVGRNPLFMPKSILRPILFFLTKTNIRCFTMATLTQALVIVAIFLELLSAFCLSLGWLNYMTKQAIQKSQNSLFLQSMLKRHLFLTK